jgi:hypothetical protein
VTAQTPQQLVRGIGGGNQSSQVFLTYLTDRAPTPQDIGSWQVGQRWINTASNPVEEFILQSLSAANGFLTANWIQLSGSQIQTINNIAPDGSGNFTIGAGSGVSITPGTNSLTIGLIGGSPAIEKINSVAPATNGNFSLTSAANSLVFSNITDGQNVEIAGGTAGEILIGTGTSTPPSYSAALTVSGSSITVPTGSQTFSTAGQGITFGTGNLLNTYVQGTFTPALSFTSGTVSTTGNGSWTQVGNMVHIFFSVSVTAISATGLNLITFSGAPTCNPDGGIGMILYKDIALDSGFTQAAFSINGSTVTGQFVEMGSSELVTTLPATAFSTSSVVNVKAWYFTS